MPSKDGVRTTVLLPEDTATRLRALADASGVSTAWVVRQAVQKFLDEHEGQTELPLRIARTRTQGSPSS